MHSTMATILRHNPLTTSLQVAKHVLRKALEWCSQHKNDPAPTQVDDTDSRKKTTDIEEWDRKFMQVDHHEVILAANYMDIKAFLDVDCKTIANMTILAANYMDIKALLNVDYKTVANMIKGKPPEEIRNTSTQEGEVGQTTHDSDSDSRKTTPDIEPRNEQYFLVKLYEPPIPLLDAGCQTVANMIKGKPPEKIRKTFNIQNHFILEIRKTFNIQNDFTPETKNEWVDSRLEERNLLIKKTAGAGEATTLSTRRRGVTSSKKRPGSRDAPVVSSIPDLAIVDAFPCRVFHKSRHQNSLGVDLLPCRLVLMACPLPWRCPRLRQRFSDAHSSCDDPRRATIHPELHTCSKLLSMALVKQDDELVIKPEAVAPNVNYADWPLLLKNWYQRARQQEDGVPPGMLTSQ
jgi:hypothetical protein